ncbi:mitochondrial ribosomal death-associated protein 3 domain-containing protein [Phthorimaea operculella]|nr:mitochondrial ribosomal death-associated protein 3 domain-containing protein [Phthorimaea operculella]
MSFLTDLYHRSLAENEKNIRFWEDYLTNLKALDFSAYTEKLRVPVMVPIGSRILFRGELKHTNEITVALGADYFVKCSVKQAEVLRQHRIKDAEEKLEMFRKGREYIEKQVSFKNENIFENQGQEIIEVHSEEEDKAWREKHRENVKQWKQKKSDDDKPQDTITDEELWNRLEELELQEELENELVKDEKQPEINIVKPFVVKEEETFRDKNRKHLAKDNNEIMKAVEQESNSEQTNIPKQEKEIKSTEAEVPKVAGKIELLQKVIEKQSELEEKLLELRNKETAKSKTEQDLIAKLDQMEALEELEDEMDRLEDIIDEENVTSEEELEEKPAESIPQTDPKKRVWRQLCRRYSQAVNFRTSEASPSQHDANQVGLFYTMKPEVCKQLFAHGGLPKSFMKQTKTFTETAVMVREPALDVLDCIKATDFEKPVVRYLLYGEQGTGKSLTLAHLLHYAHEDGYLIVHVPWVSEWLRRVQRHKEMSNSQSREGFVDLPLDAAAWLLHFKSQNQALLKNSDMKISKEYVWSKREKTEAGAPLAELVEHGITRVKYACDVIDALVHEIKALSNAKVYLYFSRKRLKIGEICQDGFNCFFYPLTRLRTPTKRQVKPEEVSLTPSFMELTKNDWKNGVIVLSADELAVPKDHQDSYLPKYLLYKKGFEHLDPFVPIEVPRYSEKEFVSCANYYRDRLWLRGPPEIEMELKHTSARNPYKFMEQCAPL